MNFPGAPKGYVPVEAYESLQQTIAQLLARIEDIERRLSLNSSNSSKPPSNDGMNNPAASSGVSQVSYFLSRSKLRGIEPVEIKEAQG